MSSRHHRVVTERSGEKLAKISDEDFVRAWIKCGSMNELGVVLGGLSRQACSQRASLLRRAGVRLPRMMRKIDADGLNAIIAAAIDAGEVAEDRMASRVFSYGPRLRQLREAAEAGDGTITIDQWAEVAGVARYKAQGYLYSLSGREVITKIGVGHFRVLPEKPEAPCTETL